MKDIILGTSHTLSTTVTEEKLACNMKSGSLPVFATPAMAALMEETAAAALSLFLDEGETSVGTALDLKHTAATPLGMKVTATAEIIEVDRRRVTFQVTVRDEQEKIGSARHDRFIVGAEKFLAKANAKNQ
ncbi:MAG TPA: thioesterase family protein [Candidatus Faecivivens stercoripullorum]|uniref:Thioesterase family protein n=1 Tax=Candidatus Faecivivens stercoripullorum TaxID=2840805 RepID=A0A9D1KQZ1_9FIRM|nr:thioesterase family protein [Candidatus Faecivivens stercoripullorum]